MSIIVFDDIVVLLWVYECYWLWWHCYTFM